MLKASARAETVARNSRFTAVLLPLASLQEIRGYVEQLRAEHPGAAHVVHAAVVGNGVNSLQYGVSDDGEPKGTSGRPALEVLKGSALTNVLLGVVRYFGGTKLGTGGLVRAYADAARAVLQVARTEPLLEKCGIRLILGYDIYEATRRALCDSGVTITDEQFGTEVVVTGTVRTDVVDALEQAVRDATRGSSHIEIGEHLAY